MRKTLIAGGTGGFVGKHLISFLADKGCLVNVLTREANSKILDNIYFFHWNIEQRHIDKSAFEDVDTIINLTGANIGEKSWTKERKSEIISRIDSIDLPYEYVSENKFSIKCIQYRYFYSHLQLFIEQ